MHDLLYYARAVHFAATVMAAGVVFFAVYVAEPAFRRAADDARLVAALRSRFASIAWISIAFCVLSGAAWLVLTAASMSGQPLAQVYAQGVIWTVLTQTDFGNDWLARFAVAGALAAVCVPLRSAPGAKSRGLKAIAVSLAAALVGGLAFAGHAIGAEGIEGIVHPAADILHLIAAAAWVGALVPLALLLAMSGTKPDMLAVARTATLRFSTLGIAAVATLLLTGIVNTWYLVGGVAPLSETHYGHLLLIKIALFLLMVAIAAYNWSQLTPRLVESTDAATMRRACRRLRANATIEAALGTGIIAIVAVLGTLPPASHANHHAAAGAIPADASFQHIHGETGMADVTIEPGRVGTAKATIHLWDENLQTLAAQAVTLTLAAPTPGSKPTSRVAILDPEGEWQVDGLQLTEPGNWTVEVDAVLDAGNRLSLAAPIVIDAQ